METLGGRLEATEGGWKARRGGDEVWSLKEDEGKSAGKGNENALLTSLFLHRDKLSAGIIVAGWDPLSGGTVYNIPLGGGLFKAPWAIGGSGSTYIYGYCDANYRDTWGKEETVEFVRNGASYLSLLLLSLPSVY